MTSCHRQKEYDDEAQRNRLCVLFATGFVNKYSRISKNLSPFSVLEAGLVIIFRDKLGM